MFTLQTTEMFKGGNKNVDKPLLCGAFTYVTPVQDQNMTTVLSLYWVQSFTLLFQYLAISLI